MANPTDPAPSEGTHRGTLILHLTPDGTRDRDATAMLDDLRNRAADARAAGTLSPELNLDFRVQEGGPPRGLPVNVEIRGAEISVLRKIAAEYMQYLKTVDGVYDISTDLEPGKREYRFRVNELRAAQADTSVLEIARTIRAAFDGTVASQVHEGEDEIEVRVRFPDEARRNLATLNEVSIENKNGFLVPLASVTAWEQQEGYALINRLNFKRVGQVQANIDDTVTTSVAVNALLAKKFQDIESRYPGYSINYGGEEEERQESLSNLMVLFLFAMITIYMILASFFRSLITPIIVMSAIPFGLVGVILALMAHLQPLSFMSLLGVVSLTGVIVSNTLVLVEFINITRKEGLSLLETLVRVGSLRFRPVILTSATTVLGLLPTVYGIGGQDAFVQPLALAFGYGLIFATFITLVLIPCLYYIVEDMKAKVRGVLARIQS
ncbi:MAG: efflux RND transporter permease subunit [Leptospiraceae bacterium]|nr:efflux RND transporter permease subunit [Leptospiraceae bacterium]